MWTKIKTMRHITYHIPIRDEVIKLYFYTEVIVFPHAFENVTTLSSDLNPFKPVRTSELLK